MWLITENVNNEKVGIKQKMRPALRVFKLSEMNTMKIIKIFKHSCLGISMNKKGIIFTIIAIALLSFFLVSYTIFYSINTRESVTKRIETMNNFVNLVEEDLPRQLYISGFRVIFLFNKRIADTGDYMINFNSTFKECFYNGTIYGEAQTLMDGVKLEDIEDALNEKARNINVNISLTNSNISIYQESPWFIKVVLNANLEIRDEGDLASWNRAASFETYIPVEGFEDPLYVVETNGLVTNKINKTIYEGFVNGADVSNLSSHVENLYYKASDTAPSFLDRLEGINSANANGIESLVYLPRLSSQGITLKQKSVVDYIYFSSDNPLSNQIQGMPSWFRLDVEHHDDYEVAGLVV